MHPYFIPAPLSPCPSKPREIVTDIPPFPLIIHKEHGFNSEAATWLIAPGQQRYSLVSMTYPHTTDLCHMAASFYPTCNLLTRSIIRRIRIGYGITFASYLKSKKESTGHPKAYPRNCI